MADEFFTLYELRLVARAPKTWDDAQSEGILEVLETNVTKVMAAVTGALQASFPDLQFTFGDESYHELAPMDIVLEPNSTD